MTQTLSKPSAETKLSTRLSNRGVDQMLWSAIGASIFPGASDESKLMAIDYCKSRKLDILKKPCHIVPMNVKDSKTGSYSWRDIIMPGIAEARITASRTGNYAGQDPAIYGPMVEFKAGSQTHSVPEYCTITVYRMMEGQRVAYSHTEYFEEACNTTKDGSLNSMWTKRKRGQLAKCAEAGALRKAFPEEMGGLVTVEEVDESPDIRVTTGRVVDQEEGNARINHFDSFPDEAEDPPTKAEKSGGKSKLEAAVEAAGDQDQEEGGLL